MTLHFSIFFFYFLTIFYFRKYNYNTINLISTSFLSPTPKLLLLLSYLKHIGTKNSKDRQCIYTAGHSPQKRDPPHFWNLRFARFYKNIKEIFIWQTEKVFLLHQDNIPHLQDIFLEIQKEAQIRSA